MSGSLDAHVLEFPEVGPPRFRVWPVSRAESESQGGQGSGQGAVPREGAVLPEHDGESWAAVPRAGRVFRVVICEACGWQYGSYWPRQDPVTWGDCPSCGSVTVIEGAYRPASGREGAAGASGSSARARAAQPAQQELKL